MEQDFEPDQEKKQDEEKEEEEIDEEKGDVDELLDNKLWDDNFSLGGSEDE